MVKLWLTRPSEYAEKTAQALGNYELILYPLLQYRLLEAPNLELGQGAVVAFTSAFGVEAFAKAYSPEIKAYCVGDSTARTAEGFGMQVVSADGDVEALQQLITSQVSKNEKIWHFAGTQTAGNLQGALQACGYEVEKVALYETETCKKLDDGLIRELRQGLIHGVLLYSPKTAVSFTGLLKPLGALPSLKLFCLSQNVADKLPQSEQVFIAQKPHEESLLELLNQQFGPNQ